MDILPVLLATRLAALQSKSYVSIFPILKMNESEPCRFAALVVQICTFTSFKIFCLGYPLLFLVEQNLGELQKWWRWTAVCRVNYKGEILEFTANTKFRWKIGERALYCHRFSLLYIVEMLFTKMHTKKVLKTRLWNSLLVSILLGIFWLKQFTGPPRYCHKDLCTN